MASGPRPVSRTERLELARDVCNRVLAAFGGHVLAVATCGPVARGADGPYTGLEMFAVLRQPAEAAERHMVIGGIKVALWLTPIDELVRAAARVTPDWPLTAERYRSLAPVYDPGDLCSRVRQAAQSVPREAFRDAIRALVIDLYGLTGHLRAARDQHDDGAVRGLAGALVRGCARLAGLANRTCYADEADLLARSLALPLMPDGFSQLAGLLAAGELADTRRLYQACEEAWAGVDRFATSLAIRYRDDEPAV